MFGSRPGLPVLAWVILVPGLVLAEPSKTSLDRYIAQPDASYQWKLEKTVQRDGCTLYAIDLTSQTWRDSSEVDRTVWKHWLTIVKPDTVKSDQCLLFISGGKNGDPAPEANPMIEPIAVATGAVVAQIGMIPNQPLVFGGDGKKRVEDDLIAYTWDKFMTTGDDLWPARLPMVKSTVRAMDTVQAFLGSPEGGNVKINKFVVAGGSKRGWTTWLTAAVDERVDAIVPIVIDVLNVTKSMKHHFAAYGFWAPAIGDYVHHKIVDRMDTPENAALIAIEDPLSYVDRLTLPKYLINATGDEFFLPDSSQFYFEQLKGPKYLRYVPNANHSLRDTDARESLAAFFHAIITNAPLPEFSWKFEGENQLTVQVSKGKVLQANLWQATNAKARDFRVDTIGRSYTNSTLEPVRQGVYQVRVPKPEEGWTAYFVELTFESGFAFPYKFTTSVQVTPDVLPFADKVNGATASRP